MTLVSASIIPKAMFIKETDKTIMKMKDFVGTMIDLANKKQAGIRLHPWISSPGNRKNRAAHKKVQIHLNALNAQQRALAEDQWPNDLLTRLMQACDEETGERMQD